MGTGVARKGGQRGGSFLFVEVVGDGDGRHLIGVRGVGDGVGTENSICSDDRQLESALLHGKPYWGSRVGHRVAQWEGVQREAGAEWGLCGKNHWTLKIVGTWGNGI